jgi:hypothetical protein
VIPQIQRNPQEEGRKECIAIYESLIILAVPHHTRIRAGPVPHNTRSPSSYPQPTIAYSGDSITSILAYADRRTRTNCQQLQTGDAILRTRAHGQRSLRTTDLVQRSIQIKYTSIFNVTYNIGNSLTGEYGEKIPDIRSREMRGFIDRSNYGFTIQKKYHCALTHWS